MEVQAHIFRSATEIQSRPDALMESRAAATFFTLLGVLEILHSYKSFVKMDVGRKLPEASRFNISKKIYANRFALSDTHNKISGLLNMKDTAELLSLRTLLLSCRNFDFIFPFFQ